MAIRAVIFLCMVFACAEGGPAYALCISGCIAALSPTIVATGGAVLAAEIAACTAMCAPFALGCLADGTKVVRMGHVACSSPELPKLDFCNITQVVDVEDVRIGDIVLTLNSQGSRIGTPVIHNIRHEDAAIDFMDVDVLAEFGVEIAPPVHHLSATSNHNMIHINVSTGLHHVVEAGDLKVGMVLPLGSSVGTVLQVETRVSTHKNELVTAAGTVLANDILLTTMCSGYGDGADTADEVLLGWIDSHVTESPWAQMVISPESYVVQSTSNRDHFALHSSFAEKAITSVLTVAN